MSILIKGAKMPKNCKTCGFVVCDDEYSPEYWCPIVRDNVDGYVDGIRPTFCPLVEIPPHGDLVDKDKLVNVLFDLLDDSYKPIHDMLLEVEIAPTVIESEEADHEHE